VAKWNPIRPRETGSYSTVFFRQGRVRTGWAASGFAMQRRAGTTRPEMVLIEGAKLYAIKP